MRLSWVIGKAIKSSKGFVVEALTTTLSIMRSPSELIYFEHWTRAGSCLIWFMYFRQTIDNVKMGVQMFNAKIIPISYSKGRIFDGILFTVHVKLLFFLSSNDPGHFKNILIILLLVQYLWLRICSKLNSPKTWKNRYKISNNSRCRSIYKFYYISGCWVTLQAWKCF